MQVIHHETQTGPSLKLPRADSTLLADAHPVAVAVEAGGGVVLTADPAELSRLAGPYRTVAIEALGAGTPGRRGRDREPGSNR